MKDPAARRRVSQRTALTLMATVLTAGALAVIIYFATTSLPYLLSSPTSDPRFGALNHCLLDALGEGSAGYAVEAAGRAAAFSNSLVALCAPASDGGASRQTAPVAGVVDAAFDGDGVLWLASAGGLWKWPRSAPAPERAGDLSPVALAGHARGIVALEGNGRLISLGAGGEVLGFFQLPGAVRHARLASDAVGRLVSVQTGGGLFVLDAATLQRLRAEAPCEVEYLWWTPRAGRALVACGPDQTWALLVDAVSGDREEAPRRKRSPSHLLAGSNTYVQACEHLPCTAPTP